ncbi:hypothetical protein GIB67_025928 [Kingdonia uniflora]|uniref:Pectinesterase n=1 Tax=Kingdonia uniflora TaxID=39325 RepID=A0A7J7NZB7_9MAGN|nr:hypothetical protein GIB67_025928 [Kingdonia uniflora]
MVKICVRLGIVTLNKLMGLLQNTVKAFPGGIGMQAVALRVTRDKSVFANVRVLGSQDTLLDLSRTHYFYKCYIQGSIDFIFGTLSVLYIHRFGAIGVNRQGERLFPNKYRGKGANPRKRVPWVKSFNYEETESFIDKNFINGDEWLRL